MINQSIDSDLNSKAKNEANIYLVNFVNSINSVFDSSISLTKLSNDLHEVLISDGFNDYQIKSGKGDKTIYKYLYDGYLGVKFNDKFKKAYDILYSDVSSYYNEMHKYQRENVSDPFYMQSSPQERMYMTFEVLCKALMTGVTLDELINYKYQNYIENYIINDRIKNKSIADKQQRTSMRENAMYHVPTEDDVKRAIIIGAVIFGIAALGKFEYEIHKYEENKNNKPSHESIVKNSPSQRVMIDGGLQATYNYESNEFVIGGRS